MATAGTAGATCPTRGARAGFWKTGNLENCASRDEDWGGECRVLARRAGGSGDLENWNSGELGSWGTGELGNWGTGRATSQLPGRRGNCREGNYGGGLLRIMRGG